MAKDLPKVTVEVSQYEGGLELLIKGQPVPASRPRVARFGTYYAPTYKNWMKAVEDALDGLWHVVEKEELGCFHVSVECVFKRPKKLVNELPRPDIDNVLKGPLDMVTKRKLVWKDDTQVSIIHATKRYARVGEDPFMILIAKKV